MKKALWIVTLLTIVGYISGCTLEDVLDLGGGCPGVQYVLMPNGKSKCSVNDITMECEVHIKNGVFSSERCPVSYSCVNNGSETFCECDEPCDSACCPQNTICDPYTKTCVPKDGAKCTTDAQCNTLDTTMPYCDTATGKCVACLDGNKDKSCPDELICENKTCVECSDTTPCRDENDICNDGRCVECLGNELPECNDHNDQIKICVDGVFKSVQCPEQIPFCQNGECIECRTNADCSGKKGLQYCINNLCIECQVDSDCDGMIKDGIETQFCLENFCSACKSDEHCENTNLPACNSILGKCAECSETTPGNQCQDNVYISCDVYNGKLVEEKCDNSCDTQKGCVDCVLNEDCKYPNKICTPNKTCIECETDEHCADHPDNKPLCNTDTGMCYECKTDDECKNSPNGKYCLTEDDQNICVECMSNLDCKESDKPTCSDHVCVNECKLDSDCNEGYRCVDKECRPPKTHGECYDNSDCTQVEGKPACLESEQICVECTKKSDCDTNSKGKFCDSKTHTCSGCETDAECGATTPKCNTITNACVECLNDGDCDTNACVNYQCVDCKGSESLCENSDYRKYCQSNTWQIDDCNGKGCSNGSCNTCMPNTKECVGNELVTCDSNGNKSSTHCDDYCYNKKCVECMPGSNDYCIGDVLHSCDDSGNHTAEYCVYGCAGDRCRSFVCSENTTRCSSSSEMQTCHDNAWGNAQNCTYGCSNDSCNKLRYVKIVPTGTSNGPDIDAVVVVRKGYSYSRNCNTNGTCFAAIDATGSYDSKYGNLYQTTGIPNAFTLYPSDTTCYYRSSAYDDTSFTFATLTSETVFYFDNTINSGDSLYIFELSNCTLQNAGTSTGNQALQDSFEIHVSHDLYSWTRIDDTSSGGIITSLVSY